MVSTGIWLFQNLTLDGAAIPCNGISFQIIVFIFFFWLKRAFSYVLWSRNFLDGFILSLWYFKVLFNSNPLFIFNSNSVYFCIRVFITRNILTDLKALRNHCQEAYLSLFFYCLVGLYIFLEIQAPTRDSLYEAGILAKEPLYWILFCKLEFRG